VTRTGNALVLALPKGRILEEVLPLLDRVGIQPEAAFHDSKSRALAFDTNVPGLRIIRVRAFDAATFVAFGGADMGVVGSDVIDEFNYDDLYAPVDLGIGKCRLSVAMPDALAGTLDDRSSHVRVATKYPNLTRSYYAARGQQAECIKLNGAMELAPMLGLCDRIVDLVSTGGTLRANKLTEMDEVIQISSRLVVSRPAFKTRPAVIAPWVDKFRAAVAGSGTDAGAGSETDAGSGAGAADA